MLKSITLYLFLLSLPCVLAVSTGQGSDQTTELAYDRIRSLQPQLSKARAKTLAHAFMTVANEESCQMPWQILAAIAYNESSLGVSNVNARSKDYGIMQINTRTMARMGLNHNRVMKDDGYSISAACKILRDNKNHYGNKPYWIGIYRSGTAFANPKIVANAKRYHKIIMRTAYAINNEQVLHYAQVQ